MNPAPMTPTSDRTVSLLQETSIPKVGLITLEQLPRGLCAAVARIDAADDDLQRLMAMGVCLGRRVELVQTGDPLILLVLSTRVGVSARLAQRVWVEACDAPECKTSQA